MPSRSKKVLADDETIGTLKLKIRSESNAWLEEGSVESNQVFNWCNETSYKAIRPFAGAGRWLSAYELHELSAGATKFFKVIGADTIQCIASEFVTRRVQFKKHKLRWRVSSGARRSLGWIPFKAASIRRKGKYITFCGKTIRFFEHKRFAEIKSWQGGCFSQDAVGDWYLCLPCVIKKRLDVAPQEEVGIDLGLKDSAVTSDGARLERGSYYRDLEPQIAIAQRRGDKKKVRALHRKAARCRADALHKFSRKIVKSYQKIVIGDVSSQKLVKTRFAKSVLDTGWGVLKAQLQYKGKNAGRSVSIVNERNTTRTCSTCKALTGPAGVNGLRVRIWKCHECGTTHDRDVNSARNILSVGRCPESVCDNEPKPLRPAPSSRVSHSRKTGKAQAAVAA